MKTAALILGSLFLSNLAFASEAKTKDAKSLAGDRSAVTPKTPTNATAVPAASAPSEELRTALPTDLITTSLGGKDVEFLITVLENGRVQAWLGEVARDKADSEQIRAIGEALQSTQAEENRLVSDLAKRKGINVANGRGPIQKDSIASDLPKTRGPKLDKALIGQIAEASQKAVTTYEGGLHSKDDEIRRLSEQMLPVAKEKLQLANKVAGNAPQSGGQPSFRGVAPDAAPEPQ